MLGFLCKWNRNLFWCLEPSGNSITKDAVHYKKKETQRMGGVRRSYDNSAKGVASQKRDVTVCCFQTFPQPALPSPETM